MTLNLQNKAALNELGYTCLALNNLREAEKYFKAILYANADDPYGLNGLGKVELARKESNSKLGTQTVNKHAG